MEMLSRLTGIRGSCEDYTYKSGHYQQLGFFMALVIELGEIMQKRLQ